MSTLLASAFELFIHISPLDMTRTRLVLATAHLISAILAIAVTRALCALPLLPATVDETLPKGTWGVFIGAAGILGAIMQGVLSILFRHK